MAESGVSSSETTSDENTDEGLKGRRARVKELIINIGVESKKRKEKKAKETAMKAKIEEPVAKTLKRKRGQGRYTEYMIQICYRNEKEIKGKNKEKYIQVTARKGGGLRTFHYPKDQPQNVEHLIDSLMAKNKRGTRDLSEITTDGNDGEQKQTPENSLKATGKLRNGKQNQHVQQENPEQSF